jgi:site-specific DNA recombinase
LNATFAATRAHVDARVAELESERRVLERDLSRWNAQIRIVLEQAGRVGSNESNAARLADLHESIRNAERRNTEVNEEIIDLNRTVVDERDVTVALSAFDPVWASLTPREQVRIVQLLVERVDYDGAAGKVSVTFYPSGIKDLAAEAAGQRREKIALRSRLPTS